MENDAQFSPRSLLLCSLSEELWKSQRIEKWLLMIIIIKKM